MTFAKGFQSSFRAALVSSILLTAAFPLVSTAKAQDSDPAAVDAVTAGTVVPAAPSETLTIAVGSSEPGHIDLMERIARSFNTQIGSGDVSDRALISLIYVEDSAAAMAAADAGRADLALTALENLHNDPVFGDRFETMWKRPVAIELLTIVTRRTRMVRDPRQLNGLKVELAGDRVDRITKHMNQMLAPHGVGIQGGSFISAGGMSETDAFLRLCQSEYDVRVDMVIHPMKAFSGELPCAVSFMSFNSLDVPDTDGIGVMRSIVPTQTYPWQRGDLVSLGVAVALMDPADRANPVLRDGLARFLDGLSATDPAVLSAFDASLWAGETPTVD